MSTSGAPAPTLISCPCSLCGPNAPPVPLQTRRDHLAADRERNLKRNAPEGEVLSAREFMRRKREKLDVEDRQLGAPHTGTDIEMDFAVSDLSLGSASLSPGGLSSMMADPAGLYAQAGGGFESAQSTRSADARIDIPQAEEADAPSLGSAPDGAPSSVDASHEASLRSPGEDAMDVDSETPILRPRDSSSQRCPPELWFWDPIMWVIAWLHLHFHTPHRACILLLKVLRDIFIFLKLIKAASDVPITLTTACKRLSLDEDFEIRAICPTCRRAYSQATPPPDLLCTHCRVPLFRAAPPAPEREPVATSSVPSKPTSKLKPVLQAPYLLPSKQLVEFLNRDNNEAACESYLTRKRITGKLRDIQDGDVCQNLKGPDGRKFFDTDPDRPDPHELRIGLCFGEDGFSFTRSKDSSTHSTGAASFCVIGLPHHLRYRPRNLLLTSLGPGPHEETCDEFQRTMGATVTDLLTLYDHGVVVQTQKYPKGRRIRVALVCVCCDHPAMCKCGGFADHSSKKWPCTCCGITWDEIRSALGLKVDGFPARDGEQHRREAQEYAKIPETDKAKRDEFVKKFGTRYYEFSRLPYFDAVRMIIIDPMHCIFLGIMKTFWLDGWIREPAPVLRKRTEKKPREIDQIHQYLQAMEMPSWVARLPNQVGYPAGGNLTSDEWKGMLLVFCPLIIPHIWAEWYPIAVSDYEKSVANREKKEKARLARIANKKATKDDKKGPLPEPKPIRMPENDPDLLLKLAAFCKIILSGTIDLDALPRAQQLLEEFLAGFLQNHPDLVRPNFHYITHIFRIIRDFGPVYGFWTFLFERLNKLLKSYDTNNHGGGELEVTFFREFHRDANLRELLRRTTAEQALSPEAQCRANTARLILETDVDNRGTLAAMAAEIEELSADVAMPFTMGPSTTAELTVAQQNDLLQFYVETFPSITVIGRAARQPTDRSYKFLHDRASVHSYFIRDGRRITSSQKLVGGGGSSLVQMDQNGTRYVGQILQILTHFQPGIEEPQRLLDIRWFKRDDSADVSPWSAYPELEVYAWQFNEYLGADDLGPPRIVPIHAILSQAARLTIQLKTQTIQTGGERDGDADAVDVEADTRQGPARQVWFTAGLTRDVIVV